VRLIDERHQNPYSEEWQVAALEGLIERLTTD
jgi:hypothetical protein